MDIFRFINSKDIRSYLKEINYEFTSVEAAWLVWQCESITLQEKHNAWQEIIDTMPDCAVESNQRFHFEGIESFHSFLKEFINNSEDDDKISIFSILNIDIPVPFKAGDIVYIKDEIECENNILVYGERNYIKDKYISTICYMTDCGKISRFFVHNSIMDMEYFNQGIPSEKQIFHTLSRYLKNEIPLDCLLNDYLLNTFENITLNLRKKQNLFQTSKTTYDEDLPF